MFLVGSSEIVLKWFERWGATIEIVERWVAVLLFNAPASHEACVRMIHNSSQDKEREMGALSCH